MVLLLVQSDLAITDLVITETLFYWTLFKALSSQSHLAITDKLKFWWSRYNGNLVLHVRYSKVRLYVLTVPFIPLAHQERSAHFKNRYIPFFGIQVATQEGKAHVLSRNRWWSEFAVWDR